MSGRAREETSAGGVLVRRAPPSPPNATAARPGQSEGRAGEAGGEQYEACLILRSRDRDRAWCLPKGHPEPGEDAAAAAVREVREETGTAGEILAPLGAIQYRFSAPGAHETIEKTVLFFLMRALPGTPGPLDANEVVAIRWLPLAAAAGEAAYDNERQVLRKAQALLDAGGWPEAA